MSSQTQVYDVNLMFRQECQPIFADIAPTLLLLIYLGLYNKNYNIKYCQVYSIYTNIGYVTAMNILVYM